MKKASNRIKAELSPISFKPLQVSSALAVSLCTAEDTKCSYLQALGGKQGLKYLNKFHLWMWFGNTTGFSNGSTTQLFGTWEIFLWRSPHLQEVGPSQSETKNRRGGVAMGNCNKCPAHLSEALPGKYCMGEFIPSQYPTQPAASFFDVGSGKISYLARSDFGSGDPVQITKKTCAMHCTALSESMHQDCQEQKATCGPRIHPCRDLQRHPTS